MGLFKTMVYFGLGMKCFEKVSKSVMKAIDKSNRVTIVISDGNRQETIIEASKDKKLGENKN